MTTQDFLSALFYAVAQEMLDVPKRPDATRYPSAVVTLAWLFALKGGGTRAFSRWLTRAYLPLLPPVPERPRLARLFPTHAAWPTRLLAAPTVLGVADSEGSERIQPLRGGRSPAQIGKQGKRKHRWISGGTLGVILNPWGWSWAWDCATANVPATPLQPLMAQVEGQRMVLTDPGCQATTGDPTTMTVCPRGPGNTRRLVETVLSMRTTVCQSQKVGHRVWADCRARIAATRAAFTLLARWGRAVDEHDRVRLSIAALSL
jgi:hypothetical protein